MKFCCVFICTLLFFYWCSLKLILWYNAVLNKIIAVR